MLRRLLIATVLASLALPAAADAAQRYVATNGSGSSCAQATPCSIEVGVNNASASDEVIIAPGTYTTSTPLANPAIDLYVHGDAGAAPLIRTSAPTGLSLNGFSAEASDLRIEHTGSDYGANLFVNSATLQRLEVHSSGNFAACVIGPGVTFRDSLCEATGGAAFAVWNDFTGGSFTAHFRNVTAIATGSSGIGLVAGSGAGTTNVVDAANMILRGGLVDAQARASGAGATTTLSLATSNFDSSNTIGSTTSVSAPGSGTNQTATPKFRDAVRYEQAFGSPTIDAGTTDAYTGTGDPFGDARPLGAAIDIGADEYVPDATPPDTTITKGPKERTRSRKAKFEFESSEPYSTFSCALDKKPLTPCESPQKLKHLDPGRHRFSVVATDEATNADPTPATYHWKVKRKR